MPEGAAGEPDGRVAASEQSREASSDGLVALAQALADELGDGVDA